MYNGQKVIDLLNERRLTAKDLLEYLGVRDNGTVARFCRNDIKASRLEQIADFFDVSTEVFFIREKDYGSGNTLVMGDLNSARDIHVGHSASSRAREFESKVKSLERELKTKDDLLKEKEERLKEKDEQIKLLKQMIEMLTPKQP